MNVPPKSKKFIWRIAAGILSLLILAGLMVIYLVWSVAFKNNIHLISEEKTYWYVPTSAGYDRLIEIIRGSGNIKNFTTFEWLAEKKNLRNHVNPGRYEIVDGMSNNEIINMLRSGRQKPLNVTFNNIRTTHQLAGNISKQIEADSLSIINLLTDIPFLSKQNLNPETVLAIFIPNTYEFYWNTNARAFFDRMLKEYKKFWNSERMNKAHTIGLNQVEVSILASIIDMETNMNDEKRRIAGVYINRLNKNWKLQADPTVKFAIGDFGLKRVLTVHTEIDSPYNTYMYYGLPPGPICLPMIVSIDAVLNYEKHNYFYFAANPDGSGYHVFAKTLNQHLANARNYHKYLNENNIK